MRRMVSTPDTNTKDKPRSMVLAVRSDTMSLIHVDQEFQRSRSNVPYGYSEERRTSSIVLSLISSFLNSETKSFSFVYRRKSFFWFLAKMKVLIGEEVEFEGEREIEEIEEIAIADTEEIDGEVGVEEDDGEDDDGDEEDEEDDDDDVQEVFQTSDGGPPAQPVEDDEDDEDDEEEDEDDDGDDDGEDSDDDDDDENGEDDEV